MQTIYLWLGALLLAASSLGLLGQEARALAPVSGVLRVVRTVDLTKTPIADFEPYIAPGLDAKSERWPGSEYGVRKQVPVGNIVVACVIIIPAVSLYAWLAWTMRTRHRRMSAAAAKASRPATPDSG